MRGPSIYDECPVHESEHFLLRLVEQGDAADLLRCYSDASAVRLMNSDNCTSDFHYETLDQMQDCIQGWLGGYHARSIVRLSIISTQDSKAVGTVELYRKTRDTGVLRLDLCSVYETHDSIAELVCLSTERLYEAFGVKHILTKAIPDAAERISALLACNYVPAEHHAMLPHGDYYIHARFEEGEMANPLMTRCGIDCEACEYREKMNCPGCQAAAGKMFWGECAVAACCIGRSLEHCGQCQDFPCKTLKEYAYHPTEGDNGARICTLQEWNEKGYDAWHAEKHQQL